MPAVEGGASAVRPALGSRNQARRISADGAPGLFRCFTKNGHDWADRFPAIVDAALRIKASSFLIDGEVVIARDDGTPVMLGNGRRRKSGQFGYLLTVCSKRPPAPF